MDGQLIAVVVIVLAAAGYVLQSAWRVFRGKKAGCASGCGKCTPAEPPKAGRVALPQVK